MSDIRIVNANLSRHWRFPWCSFHGGGLFRPTQARPPAHASAVSRLCATVFLDTAGALCDESLTVTKIPEYRLKANCTERDHDATKVDARSQAAAFLAVAMPAASCDSNESAVCSHDRNSTEHTQERGLDAINCNRQRTGQCRTGC